MLRNLGRQDLYRLYQTQFLGAVDEWMYDYVEAGIECHG